MIKEKINLLIAVTGASGAIYAQRLISKVAKLKAQSGDAGVIFSDTGKDVWHYELESVPKEVVPFRIFENDNYFTAPASGSGQFDTMIVVPCTMGTLGRIASGTADDLIVRAADVMLKERKKLILVVREMPYNLIHIQNMEKITLAGGIIIPASPSFYSKPKSIEELVDTVIDKALAQAGYNFESFSWGESS